MDCLRYKNHKRLKEEPIVTHTGDVSRMDERQFEQLFKAYYNPLFAYAYAIVHDEALAEEIVQTVFLRLWEKREAIAIQVSWKAYLYKAIYHESLNSKKRWHLHQRYVQGQGESVGVTDSTDGRELEARLEEALQQLPEKCRTVFQLSRFEELKYQEIADRLQISIKTVEAHMGKALKVLRVQLADFLVGLAFLLINLFKL